MRVTKYEHACMVLEDSNTTVVIDPGEYTTDFVVPADTAALLITHAHADHNDSAKIRDIIAINPQVPIYAHAEVIKAITAAIDGVQVHSVAAGDRVTIGSFDVQFTGGEHALIHKSIPRAANLGLLINDGAFYYPGDMLEAPDATPVPVKNLALPASAPWMSIGQAMDFLAQIAPAYTFPVHDAILSQNGKALVDKLLGGVAQTIGSRYERISDGDSRDLTS